MFVGGFSTSASGMIKLFLDIASVILAYSKLPTRPGGGDSALWSFGQQSGVVLYVSIIWLSKLVVPLCLFDKTGTYNEVHYENIYIYVYMHNGILYNGLARHPVVLCAQYDFWGTGWFGCGQGLSWVSKPPRTHSMSPPAYGLIN